MMYPALLQASNGQQIKIGIPTTWDDVPFERYYKLLQQKLNEPLAIYATLLDVDISVIRNISIEGFSLIADRMKFVEQTEAFQKTRAHGDVVFMNTYYSYVADMRTESIGCYWDWESELQNLGNDDQLKFVPRTLAYFLREKGKEYDHEQIDEREKLFWQLPALTAVQLFNFFLLRNSESTQHLKCLTKKRTLTSLLRELAASVRSAGTILMWSLPVVTYSTLRLSLVSLWVRCCSSSSGRLSNARLKRILYKSKKTNGVPKMRNPPPPPTKETKQP